MNRSYARRSVDGVTSPSGDGSYASFLAILVLVLFAGCQPQQITLNSKLAVGSPFPTLEGTDLDGEPISIADFKGKVILVDFFGDW